MTHLNGAAAFMLGGCDDDNGIIRPCAERFFKDIDRSVTSRRKQFIGVEKAADTAFLCVVGHL